jgi:hypothetical protein
MQKRFNDPGYMKHISVIQLANQKTITELWDFHSILSADSPTCKPKNHHWPLRLSFYSVSWLSKTEHKMMLLQWVLIRRYSSELWHHARWWAVTFQRHMPPPYSGWEKYVQIGANMIIVGSRSVYTDVFRRQKKPNGVERISEWWGKGCRDEEEGNWTLHHTEDNNTLQNKVASVTKMT